jgi:hypothetical protein
VFFFIYFYFLILIDKSIKLISNAVINGVVVLVEDKEKNNFALKVFDTSQSLIQQKKESFALVSDVVHRINSEYLLTVHDSFWDGCCFCIVRFLFFY